MINPTSIRLRPVDEARIDMIRARLAEQVGACLTPTDTQVIRFALEIAAHAVTKEPTTSAQENEQ